MVKIKIAILQILLSHLRYKIPNIKTGTNDDNLIKNPKNPKELKNIILKNDDITKAIKPKYGPKNNDEQYIGISEKSNFKKGNMGIGCTRPNQPKTSEIAINAELYMYLMITR